MMELKEIQKIISSVTKSGTRELKLNFDDTKMIIKNHAHEKNVENIASEVLVPPASTVKIDQPDIQSKNHCGNSGTDDHFIVKSTFIGTFNISKSTNIRVGSKVSEGDNLCTVESLNLLNELCSEVNGEIVQILVEENSPVEFDQPLFAISQEADTK